MHSKISLVIAVIGFLLINIFSVSAHADTDAGKVIFSIGKIHAVGVNGKKRILRRGSKINSGDTVVTKHRSMLQMRMADKGFIALRGNSKFKIDKFVYKKGKKKDKSHFNLLRGGFRAITGFIGKRNRAAYKVKTVSATIGIRGTDFTARICNNDCGDGNGNANNGLYVGVSKGGVTLTNDAGTLNLNPLQNGYVAGKKFTPKPLAKAPKLLFFKSRKPGQEMGDEEGGDKDAGNEKRERREGQRQRQGENREGGSGENSPPGGEGDGEPMQPQSGGDKDGDPMQPAPGEERTTTEPEPREFVFDQTLTDRELAGAITPEGELPLENFERPVDEAPVIDIEFSTTRKVAIATGPKDTDQHFTRANLNIVERVNILNDRVSSFDIIVDTKAFEVTRGTANHIDVGRDPNTGILWGRWAEGVAGLKSQDGSVSAIDLTNSSLHWVVDAVPTDNIVLPKTGTFNFDLIGNTSPTDNLGNAGILGNATITADFNNMTMNTQIDVGINGQVWNATGSNAPINNNGIFNGGLNVNVNTGNSTATGQGSASGFFTNNAAAAGMGYSMDANVNGTPTTVSGAAAFRAR